MKIIAKATEALRHKATKLYKQRRKFTIYISVNSVRQARFDRLNASQFGKLVLASDTMSLPNCSTQHTAPIVEPNEAKIPAC